MSNYQVSPLTSTARVDAVGVGQPKGQQTLQRKPLPQIANSSNPPVHSTAKDEALKASPEKHQPEHEDQRPPPLELEEPTQDQQMTGRSGGGGRWGGDSQWTARSSVMNEEEEQQQTEHIRHLMFTMRQAELKRRLQEASRKDDSEAIEQALTLFHDEYQLNPRNDEDVKLVLRAERQLEFARVKEGVQEPPDHLTKCLVCNFDWCELSSDFRACRCAAELVTALYRGQREELELLMQGIESHERGAEFKSRLTTELIYARQLVSSQREFDPIPKKVTLNSATMVEVRVQYVQYSDCRASDTALLNPAATRPRRKYLIIS